jgi:superfamily II DNA or RNA helicase
MSWDRGTLLLEPGPDGPAVSELPGVLWDPRVQRFRAPAWRHGELAAVLAGLGVAVEDRARLSLATPVPWPSPSLRGYQAGAVAAWEAAGRRGVVVLPTGSGKTRVALAAMAGCGLRTLCVVPTRVLVEQWARVLAEHYPGAVGRFGDGLREERPLSISTYASALVHAERLGQRFDLLVVDEAHHFGGGGQDEILELSLASARLGLTATPPDDTARLLRLSELVGPVVYQLAIDDLAGRFLAPYELITLRLPLCEPERAVYEAERAAFERVHRPWARGNPGGRWQDFLAAAVRSEEGRRALEGWRRSREVVAFTEAKRGAVERLLAEQVAARVLVFTPDNDTAYQVARAHLVMPLTCAAGRAERSEALRRFAAGELRVLVSSQVLNEGLDVPAADVAIVVGGRGGDREYLQRVGRVLRPAPGKRARIVQLVSAGTFEEGQAQRRGAWLAAG